MMKSLSDAVFEVEADGRVVGVLLDDENNVLRRSGLVPGQHLEAFLEPQARGAFLDSLALALQGPGPVVFQCLCLAGGRHELRLKLSAKTPASGKEQEATPRALALVQDVTGVLEAHRNLAERFESIVDAIPVFLLEFSSSRQLDWVNRSCQETIQGEALHGLGETLPVPGEGWKDFRLPAHSGCELDTSWATILLDDGRLIAIGRDVSERRELEEARARQVHSARLAALGEMAGGIAHEINNPLTVIQGRGFQTLLKLEEENPQVDRVRADVEKIIQTAHRIAKIVKGLRMFSRNAERDPLEPIPLEAIFEDVLELSRERLRSDGIEFRVDLGYRESVPCRAVQVAQVLLNLVNNAADAVKGTPGAWIELSSRLSGDWVSIWVTDSGNGVPEDVATHIMEPFFTTKDVGKGAGLGLSIAKGIVEEHGGTLSLDSHSPHTRFVVELPLRMAEGG